MKRSLSAVVLVIFCKLTISIASSSDYKLELLQVTFRHGDRIPDENEIYESDPYIKLYESEGFGQLTKIGLQREYKIGQMLKERYSDFLGEFKCNEVHARSTDLDRTKMSLQMVLAGLYPPSSKTLWSNDIFWSPIPTHYLPTHIDPFRLNFNDTCTNFKSMFEEAQNSFEIQKQLHKYQDFLDYLQENTGIPDRKPFTVFMIYSNLRTVLSMGLPLPTWCSAEDYKKLEDITEICLQSLSLTLAMRKTFAGMMINEFLKNIDNSERNMNTKKIYLFGAHDTNIAAITRAHNFTQIPLVPDYGSTLIIEKLRGKDNRSYMKMLLWTGVSEQLIPLEINNCGIVCSLSKYKKIIEPTLADDKIKNCKLPNHCCEKRMYT